VPSAINGVIATEVRRTHGCGYRLKLDVAVLRPVERSFGRGGLA
jgi:hypothetical protein